MSLAGFNALDAGSARRQLLACCDVPGWADRLAEGRPYGDAAALLAAADRAMRELTDSDVDRALAAHPRIGERASGWSGGEQAGVVRDDRTLTALAEANRQYGKRFDRVFLICASGLAADQVLAVAGTRLRNDDVTERAVVAEEHRLLDVQRELIRMAIVLGPNQLADGTIDCVVSDHSPCTPELKRFDLGDFDTAWGGIASLQVGLAGLAHKGRIALGQEADFCVFAPDEAFVVDKSKLRHKNPVTPYDGLALAGVVRSTWLRGGQIDIDGQPHERLIARGAS